MSWNRTQYVSMLMFSSDSKKVAVLTKNRPDFLAGLLCPVGGHLEENEQPLFAAVREFHEETGVMTEEHEWRLYGVCERDLSRMYCFVAFTDAVFGCTSTTDEPVEIRDTAELLAAMVENRQLGSPDLITLIGLALQVKTGGAITTLSWR